MKFMAAGAPALVPVRPRPSAFIEGLLGLVGAPQPASHAARSRVSSPERPVPLQPFDSEDGDVRGADEWRGGEQWHGLSDTKAEAGNADAAVVAAEAGNRGTIR